MSDPPVLSDDDLRNVYERVFYGMFVGDTNFTQWLIKLGDTVEAIRVGVESLRGGPVADPAVMAAALSAGLSRLSDNAVERLAVLYASEHARRRRSRSTGRQPGRRS